jgi:hypothetical protein
MDGMASDGAEVVTDCGASFTPELLVFGLGEFVDLVNRPADLLMQRQFDTLLWDLLFPVVQ